MVCQMLQQQRQRELQRLTLTGALTSTPNSPMIAQSPNLLSSATASPLQGGQGSNLFGLQDSALHKPGVSNTARFLTRIVYVFSLRPVRNIVQFALLSGYRRKGWRQEWVMIPQGAAQLKMSGIVNKHDF